jgi:hypothetical protein
MIEFKVRPVGRYIVTRYESPDGVPVGKEGSRTVGEFPNHAAAEVVAKALAKSEPGATVTSNILPSNAPAADLLRNIADHDASPGQVETGMVILLGHDGKTSVYGLGASGPQVDPHQLLKLAADELVELGIDE